MTTFVACMKTNLLLLAALIALCSGCSREKPTPVALQPVTIDIPTSVHEKLDTATLAMRKERTQKELNYYLQRHRAEDEGFEVVARYADEPEGAMKSCLPHSIGTPLGMLALKSVARQGFGVETDHLGRIYVAEWQADTMVAGYRMDENGVYAGTFDHHKQAAGHGCYRTFKGDCYFEGRWADDRRNGFGFSIDERQLQAGIWREDRYRGEHMQHTSDRIYGIDISRYQHEKGRRRYQIDWRRLTVKGLGRRISETVAENEELDYPVRFVYIKSTQGTTIRNRYYTYDYAAARRNRIPVGAYHFFSAKRSGKEQAQYFINNTLFRKGDLPPVLDLEPTDKQINQMGGAEAMLRDVRQWLNMVERRTGVKPILYINQRFALNYLTDAPDITENYLVWIARYGEYKPGLHLALWQLSADGRVNGIQTNVDINVFNGYEMQWQEFLREECIK